MEKQPGIRQNSLVLQQEPYLFTLERLQKLPQPKQLTSRLARELCIYD